MQRPPRYLDGSDLILYSSENRGRETLARMTSVGTRVSGAPQGFTTRKVDRNNGAETSNDMTSLPPDFKNGNLDHVLGSAEWIRF